MSSDPGSLGSLHDIVMASAPGWWPLAPGWYFFAAILLILGAWWGYRRWQRYRADRYRRAALAELRVIEQSPEPGAINALPTLVKRTAMQAWPREEVAALSQEAWCRFLNAHCPDRPFENEVGDLLLTLAYRPAQLGADEAQRLIESCRNWILRHRVEPC